MGVNTKREAAAVWVKIEDLTPWERNPRHNDEAAKDVAASIKRFGFGAPVVARKADGMIIAGHTRIKAAQLLGLEEVPVRYLDLDPADAQLLALADNKLGELAEWDEEELAAILRDLDIGEATEGLGFSEEELSRLLDSMEDAAPVVDDDVPELDEEGEPDSQPGVVYELGPHRLMCGDSTSAEDVGRLMGGERANMMLTDPPYNVALGMNETPEQARARNRRTDGKFVTNDHMPDDEFLAFLTSCFRLGFDFLKPGASFYIWHADSEGFNFRGAVRECGEKVRQCLIWTKDVLVMGRQDYQWQHEPCLYGWKEGGPHAWYSDRKQTTLLRFDRPFRNQEHPTMKPVDLFAYLVGNSSAPRDLVYDPFLGSGTTLIAAASLGRVCYGMEISPRYCDVIRRRWTRYARDNNLDPGPGALE